MRTPHFLTLAEVIEIHKDQIGRYGGRAGIRDMHLLQSALAQPEAGFGGEWLHKDIFEMAAAYAFHICQNHSFFDGNKRTALASSLVSLELNGISVSDSKGILYSAVIKLASSRLDKKEFSELLKSLSNV